MFVTGFMHIWFLFSVCLLPSSFLLIVLLKLRSGLSPFQNTSILLRVYESWSRLLRLVGLLGCRRCMVDSSLGLDINCCGCSCCSCLHRRKSCSIHLRRGSSLLGCPHLMWLGRHGRCGYRRGRRRCWSRSGPHDRCLGRGCRDARRCYYLLLLRWTRLLDYL